MRMIRMFLMRMMMSRLVKGPPGPFGHGFASDSHGLAPRRWVKCQEFQMSINLVVMHIYAHPHVYLHVSFIIIYDSCLVFMFIMQISHSHRCWEVVVRWMPCKWFVASFVNLVFFVLRHWKASTETSPIASLANTQPGMKVLSNIRRSSPFACAKKMSGFQSCLSIQLCIFKACAR